MNSTEKVCEEVRQRRLGDGGGQPQGNGTGQMQRERGRSLSVIKVCVHREPLVHQCKGLRDCGVASFSTGIICVGRVGSVLVDTGDLWGYFVPSCSLDKSGFVPSDLWDCLL